MRNKPPLKKNRLKRDKIFDDDYEESENIEGEESSSYTPERNFPSGMVLGGDHHLHGSSRASRKKRILKQFSSNEDWAIK